MTDIEELAEKIFISLIATHPGWETNEDAAIWSFKAAEVFIKFKNSRPDDAGGADREDA